MNPILVVDDDPDIHNFIKHDLRNTPFEVVSAMTTEEAIHQLGEHNFSFAIVDIFMGVNKSSNQVIHFLKQELAGENQNLPMAIMSAHMGDDHARKILLKGPTVFSTIQKPLKPGQLISLLEGKDHPSVLAVDDDPDILSLIKRELIKGGYTVYSSLNDLQAKKLLKTTEFIAAIIDNKLGVNKDSSELSHFLEELPSSFQVPLILTGKKINEKLSSNDHLMVFETIEKPFQRGAFLEAVNQIKLWAEKASKDSDDPNKVISGVTDHLDEERTKISGHENDDVEKTVVSGHEEDSLDAVTVSGLEDEKEEKITISGDKESLDEERTMVHGEKEVLKDESWSVKHLGNESDEGEGALNKRNKQGVTPVMAYCYTGDFEKVKELISLGADPSLKARNGKTCLHYAAHSDNSELVEFLINDHHLKINERDENKKEPLYDAIRAQNPKMIKTLIRLGARTTSKYEGRNYLTIAILMKSIEVAKVLLESGLSYTDKDYNGKSAFDYAQKFGLKDLVELMKKEKV